MRVKQKSIKITVEGRVVHQLKHCNIKKTDDIYNLKVDINMYIKEENISSENAENNGHWRMINFQRDLWPSAYMKLILISAPYSFLFKRFQGIPALYIQCN